MRLHLLPALVASVAFASALHGDTLYFQPHFGFPDYAPGSLEGKTGWSFTNGGPHSWHIAKPGSRQPRKPSALESHPTSLSGSNLFWIAARTENLGNTTNTARLTFAPTPVTGAFSASFDLYVGPQTSTSGRVLNFALGHGASIGSDPVRIYLHGGGKAANSVGVRLASNGTTEVVLPALKWYRFEIEIDPRTETSGAWSMRVHALDPDEKIGGGALLHSVSEQTYSGVPAGGFDVLLFQTTSNRSDFWVDNILVDTAPMASRNPPASNAAVISGP